MILTDWTVWHKWGDNVAQGWGRVRLAKAAQCDRATAERVVRYVRKHGGPATWRESIPTRAARERAPEGLGSPREGSYSPSAPGRLERAPESDYECGSLICPICGHAGDQLPCRCGSNRLGGMLGGAPKVTLDEALADSRVSIDPHHESTVPRPRALWPGARPRTHLVVGDAHFGAGQSLHRAGKLAHIIDTYSPDVVVVLGDWYGLDALCSHHSADEREGRRLVDDIAAGNDALYWLDDCRHRPELHFCVGNHEDRLHRLYREDPRLTGSIPDPLDRWRERGWTVHPYLQPARIDGVRYQHCMPSAGKRMLAGKYHAQRLLDRVRFAESVVVGHSHRFDYRLSIDHRGNRRHALVAGCFFDHTEHYAGEDNAEWWKGLVLLHDVTDGDYALQLLPMSYLGSEGVC